MSERRERGTGSITERNGQWQARYGFFDPSGRRRQRSAIFESKTKARQWLTARLAELAGGPTADPGSITVGQYLEEWLRSLGMAQLEAATVSWYRTAVQRHIVPAIGGIKLAKLTPVTIEAFLADKAARGHLGGRGKQARRAGQPLAPTSVRRLQVTLHKALDAAMRKGLLPRNPCDLADRVKLPASDVTLNVWTPDELTAFVQATSNDRLAALWRLDAMTGLRRSEVCGLGWPDLDLDGGRLSVRRAVVIVDGMPHVKPPKTARSRRTVELDSQTVAALREHRKAQLEERLRAGTAWTPGEWLFTNEIGQPLRPDWVGRRFSTVVAAAGLRPISMRQLRHSHATALLAAGEHPKIVQERLGHSSISITLDTYSAVLPNMQRDAVERLARSMGGG
ncbi:site-specific integrase [soil metagenome]